MILKKNFIFILMFLLSIVILSGPFDYSFLSFNPVLLDSHSRSILHLGMDADVYLGGQAANFLVLEDSLDWNNIYIQLDGDDFIANTFQTSNSSGVLTIFGVSIGTTFQINNTLNMHFSNDFVKLLTDDFVFENTLNAEGEIFLDLKINSGLYAAFDLLGLRWGGILSLYLPIVQTNSSINFNLDFINNEFSAGFESPLLSIFDLKTLESLIENEDFEYEGYELYTRSGINISLGAVNYLGNNPIFGFSLNNLTLRPANVYKYDLNFDFTEDIENNDSNDDFLQNNLIFELVDSNYLMRDTTSISAFYTFNFGVNITPYGEYFFDNSFNLGTYVHTKLLFFPLWTGFEYNRGLYNLNFGAGIDLRFIDFNLEIGFSDKNIGNIFNIENTKGKVNFAIGF